jgi:hypothetical protein
MKNFKIIHQTRRGTRQLILSAYNLNEVLKSFYAKTNTHVNIIEIYEKSGHGKWVDIEISGR